MAAKLGGRCWHSNHRYKLRLANRDLAVGRAPQLRAPPIQNQPSGRYLAQRVST
jgi:hypothetical protein